MIQAFRAIVVPELQAKSFEGSFPHFRRRSGEFLHLLSIQFNKHGGSFVVEVGRCPSDGLTFPLGKRLPASEVTVWRLHPSERIRLGADHTETDHWFRFDQLLEWDRHKSSKGRASISRQHGRELVESADVDTWVGFNMPAEVETPTSVHSECCGPPQPSPSVPIIFIQQRTVCASVHGRFRTYGRASALRSRFFNVVPAEAFSLQLGLCTGWRRRRR